MSTQSTIDKLIELKLSCMADAYRVQLEDTKVSNLSFDERLALLVDNEYYNKKNAKLKRLISTADFDQPTASVSDINFSCGRKLDRELILNLCSCEYIKNSNNLIITGATGSGKTYLACAIGIEACKQFYSTRYIRLPDMLLDLNLAGNKNNFKKTLQKYTNPTLLIIDEWLLIKYNQQEQFDIFELIHQRSKNSSTIFCSQFKVEGWYDQLGGTASPLADAILDRIIHNSYRIDIQPINKEHDISMREFYGLKNQ